LVTGGAGFIGSHLVDYLISKGEKVRVLDNLSSGNKKLINREASLYNKDLREKKALNEAFEDVDFVWHLAANPDVKIGASEPDELYKNNILATYNLLEGMRENNIKKIAFTSTSTVYGEAKIPTPETHPTIPISIYGASKLACESLIASYCHTFNMQSWMYRLANVIGPRSNHGVIFDFINKLRKNPNELEILGDGKQNKSYLYVEDCIEAMIRGLSSENLVNIFNVGNTDQIEVRRIAEIVSKEMGLTPKFKFTGGKKGWVGDVPIMLLSIDQLKTFGWFPKYTSGEAVTLTVSKTLQTN